jgi:hypothetical protein
MPLLYLIGITQMIFLASNNTLLQMITPDAVRGRVMSIYLLSIGVVPLGSFSAGILARALGSREAMLIGGGAMAALTVACAQHFGLLQRRAIPEAR